MVEAKNWKSNKAEASFYRRRLYVYNDLYLNHFLALFVHPPYFSSELLITNAKNQTKTKL
jgi:hypothetical protein